ncbi:NAD(P)/FAD-dependent oxidoreductase [Rhodopseudomonas sp. RCAM05734]|uniref:NAD(P)/FAD-dependent oxidoreductase n=1 Tax=Rhodopseudomonas sp. RCAM05734 TaxID=3457549 RepID=UPI004044F7E8
MPDVVILGAGMAGMACARTLLQRGLRPLLVAPEPDVASRGETLSFRASPYLERLGWLDLLDAETATQCQGRYSLWGSAALRRDTSHQDEQPGWHIDRRRLEARMADTLDTAGIARRRTEARQLSQGPSQVTIALADGASIDAAHVIDCTGRAAVTAGPDTPLRRLDRLVGCYCVLTLDDDVDAVAATLVEAVADGWWYMTVMPGGRSLLCYFTDSDLLPPGLRKDPALLRQLLSQTQAIAARLDSLGLDPTASGALSFAPASTATQVRLIEHRIIRAGDAASALDPLGANGLATALWSGIQAAESAIGLLAGNDSQAKDYERRFLEGIASFLTTQRAMYASERRFSDASFWRRRSHAAPAMA